VLLLPLSYDVLPRCCQLGSIGIIDVRLLQACTLPMLAVSPLAISQLPARSTRHM
jgi:hypothetical protein